MIKKREDYKLKISCSYFRLKSTAVEHQPYLLSRLPARQDWLDVGHLATSRAHVEGRLVRPVANITVIWLIDLWYCGGRLSLIVRLVLLATVRFQGRCRLGFYTRLSGTKSIGQWWWCRWLWWLRCWWESLVMLLGWCWWRWYAVGLAGYYSYYYDRHFCVVYGSRIVCWSMLWRGRCMYFITHHITVKFQDIQLAHGTSAMFD